jgi:hypothetical protein
VKERRLRRKRKKETQEKESKKKTQLGEKVKEGYSKQARR